MTQVERYLTEILGIPVRLKRMILKKSVNFPLFIKQLYRFWKGTLFGREVVFLEKKNGEHLTTEQLRKHGQIVEQVLKKTVVFIFPFLEAYNRKRLIQKQVAFVIPHKQLFIPQLLIDLKEFGQNKQKLKAKLLPAAQCLLLYHLLKENIESFNFKALAEKLGYTQMTITRAAKSLVENKLAIIEGKKNKKIIFGTNNKTLWKKALPVLQNPVKKIYHLEQLMQTNFLYLASFSALAHYTNLTEEDKKYFAVSQKDFGLLKKKKQIKIIDLNEADIILQVWNYAPGILTRGQLVDPFSLFLSLKDYPDERVQKALKGLIEQVW